MINSQLEYLTVVLRRVRSPSGLPSRNRAQALQCELSPPLATRVRLAVMRVRCRDQQSRQAIVIVAPQGIRRKQFEAIRPDLARMQAASTDGSVFALALTVQADEEGAVTICTGCLTVSRTYRVTFIIAPPLPNVQDKV